MKDKLLFTPGPLTTSDIVKYQMTRDLGSRDAEFTDIVKEIRERLLQVAKIKQDDGYETVLMQGSGTFGIESVISSAIPGGGKLLAVVNGSYGRRIVTIASTHNIPVIQLSYEEDRLASATDVSSLLNEKPDITHVAVVHCETTTGIMNPVEEIGRVVRKYGMRYIVDGMSSFGGVSLDFKEAGIDFFISSSNKCIEGVPGCSFIIAAKQSLMECRGRARTLSLDLYDQWETMEYNGQFRFTPPVQVLLAFRQALRELEEEGGVEGRGIRYRENHKLLVNGMREIGFDTYLKDELQGYIITTFLFPKDKNFDFKLLYDELNIRGFVIYPGKLTKVDSFRIGNIGQLYKNNIDELLSVVREFVETKGLVS